MPTTDLIGNPENSEEFLTNEELLKLLRIKQKLLYAWMQEGKIPYYKFGFKTIRFRTADVQEFLKRSRVAKPKQKAAAEGVPA